MNINSKKACVGLLAAGWYYALTVARGNNKGAVVSKHRTYDAANRAARGREVNVTDVAAAMTAVIRD